MEALGVSLDTIIFATINFLVVFFVLDKFLFKKLGKVLTDRQLKIDQSLKDAARIAQEVEIVEQKSAEIIGAANKKASEIVQKYTNEGKAITEEMKQVALAEISKYEIEAREKLKIEREEMLKRLKSETAELAIIATSKIIQDKLDHESDIKLVEKYLEQLK